MQPKSFGYIYNIFYVLLNIVFDLFELLYETFFKLRVKLLKPITNRNVNKFNKPLNHLTVILGPDFNHSYGLLSNLVVWCLAANINFISFYDSKGDLKRDEERFQIMVEKLKLDDSHIIWHSTPNFCHKNGIIGSKIHVKVFSDLDGKSVIVDLCKELRKSDKTNIQLIDDRLREIYEFPDPDLGLCFSQTFSLFNYPPWQIRVTEFFHIGTYCDFNFNSFVDLLAKFNKCEQRFGK